MPSCEDCPRSRVSPKLATTLHPGIRSPCREAKQVAGSSSGLRSYRFRVSGGFGMCAALRLRGFGALRLRGRPGRTGLGRHRYQESHESDLWQRSSRRSCRPLRRRSQWQINRLSSKELHRQPQLDAWPPQAVPARPFHRLLKGI